MGAGRGAVPTLSVLAIAGYRSLHDLVVPLERLNIVTGPNGSGKSSLYRALRLLAQTAQGGLVASLAREGGLRSTLWAGPERIGRSVRAGAHPVQGTVRREAVSLKLGFGAEDFGYCIDLGFPSQPAGSFALDPVIKRECIWAGPAYRQSALLVDRRGPSLRCAGPTGALEPLPETLAGFESMMTEFSDPRDAPEMAAVRQKLRSWRFYDHFRTDSDAPCRRPQVGTHTPALADDGADLAAALETIRVIGDKRGLDDAIDDAFPGAAIEVIDTDGWFKIAMHQHGLLRALETSELSDGTLRYLILVAALLSPRPPELLVLNEPETSLHADLIAPLARLVERASRHSQTIVVTHDRRLVELLSEVRDAKLIELEKDFGETRVKGALDSRPRWEWPKR
ncbi:MULTISPECIES: AAA family ATPase [Methylosinus]|uniref:ATP-binding protein n=1 Tax=Methylosinus trichosporium (strain ATCC 35070 / NCIMB 11131 / UNIQEM 75 / OB3b) TaxID=595536 RepID=A0A2D2CY09_METT3|nr:MULTISPECIES: AAA family ATPase [Methylosinus]ATQ67618.1 ATP-binding protein [Methylosinus trichosporium OB3b]OBS52159.1 ATP-binding protein [Methylosinus sp. 3S-1]